MKGKLNKILTTTALAAALAIGSIVPAVAADDEDTSTITSYGSVETKIQVGVATDVSQVATISVDVPTVIALAVVDTGEVDDEPYVLVSSTGSTENSAGEGAVTFTNRSKDGSGAGLAVYVRQAKFNVVGETWKLGDFDSLAVNEIGLELNGEKVAAATKGSVSTLNLNTPLTAPEDPSIGEATSLSLLADVGGETGDYSEEGAQNAATAFTVEWWISNSDGTEGENAAADLE